MSKAPTLIIASLFFLGPLWRDLGGAEVVFPENWAMFSKKYRSCQAHFQTFDASGIARELDRFQIAQLLTSRGLSSDALKPNGQILLTSTSDAYRLADAICSTIEPSQTLRLALNCGNEALTAQEVDGNGNICARAH